MGTRSDGVPINLFWDILLQKYQETTCLKSEKMNENESQSHRKMLRYFEKNKEDMSSLFFVERR